MISQFKTVKRNTEFLLRLNNWVIHTSSISIPAVARGRVWVRPGARSAEMQLLRLFGFMKQATVRGVLRGKWTMVSLLVFISIRLFLSYQWWPTLRGREGEFLVYFHYATIAMLHVAWSGGSLLCSPICWLLLIYFLLPARTCLTKSVLPETGIRRLNID